MGYVYILSFVSFSKSKELKIGFSEHHSEHRALELARCLTYPQVIGHTPRLPHSKRIESLLYMELAPSRKVRYCTDCQRQHKEFFTVSPAAARRVVTRWGRWILQQSYEDGALTKQWKDHLAAQDFSGARTNDALDKVWTNDFRTSESRESKEELMGSYVNALYEERSKERRGEVESKGR